MLLDIDVDVAASDSATVAKRYVAALAAVADTADLDGHLDPAVVSAIEATDPAGVTVEHAATVLEATGEIDDAGVFIADVTDRLLLGMTTAIVDVDTVSANVDVDLAPGEVQRRVEGRTPMTIEEYAAIEQFLESRTR